MLLIKRKNIIERNEVMNKENIKTQMIVKEQTINVLRSFIGDDN